MRRELDDKMQELKEREKVSYRGKIVELEEKIVSLGFELDDANKRASP